MVTTSCRSKNQRHLPMMRPQHGVMPIICVLLATLSPALAGAPSAPSRIHGITRPHHAATLSPTSPGRVERILVHEGSSVTNGQALVELDSAHEELEVRRRKLVYESEAELQAAQSRVATFKRDLEATQSLYDSQSVSREELDRKQLEFDLAEAELLKTQIGKKREYIEFEMAQKALQERCIFSPLTGQVTGLHIEEGECCEQQQPVVTVVDVSRVECVANVDAATLAGFSEGQSIELDVNVADSTARFTGTVFYAAPIVDGGSGLGNLIIAIPNPDGVILPGVAATIVSSSLTGAKR